MVCPYALRVWRDAGRARGKYRMRMRVPLSSVPDPVGLFFPRTIVLSVALIGVKVLSVTTAPPVIEKLSAVGL